MSVKNREIDENGYVIIEPLIQVSKLNVPFVDVALQKKSSRDTSNPASVSE